MSRYALVNTGPRAGVAVQDRGAVIEHAGGVVIVVADGAGGSAGGARAAERLVGAVRRVVEQGSLLPDAGRWARTLLDLDLALSQDPEAGETTAVIVGLSGGRLSGASVGDSGAWLYGPSGAVELTHAQARKPLVGSGEARPAPFTREGWSGTLVVATDGLWKYVPEERVEALSAGADLELAVEGLVAAARLPSGALQDDVTVVLYR